MYKYVLKFSGIPGMLKVLIRGGFYEFLLNSQHLTVKVIHEVMELLKKDLENKTKECEKI